MAQMNAMDEQNDYNSVAVQVAAALTEARTSAAAVAQNRPIEKRFPPFHRPGLGVAREYDRMGNRPVTEELEHRANDLGIRFEHLGITLGTVLHGLNLKETLNENQARFVRDCLLERKVIFFRDQHLSEDEQVAFGRLFGGLDAFPFGRAGDNPFILEISHDKVFAHFPDIRVFKSCYKITSQQGRVSLRQKALPCLGIDLKVHNVPEGLFIESYDLDQTAT